MPKTELKIKQLKHKRVEEELRQLAATLPVGAKLPAERDLAIEYDCNFLTVRKALKQLVDDNLITRRIGSGTFISPREVLPANGKGNSKPNRIGMLVYEKGNAYAFGVVQAIAHASLTRSVEVRSCWVRKFDSDGIRQAETLVEDGCVALILPWFPHTLTEEIRNFIHQCPVPVSLPILIPGLEKNCFVRKSDFGRALLSRTEAICHYFLELGCRRIAFLGPDAPDDLILQQRLGAYSCFASRENLPMLCGLVPPGSSAMDQLAQRWKEDVGELAILSYDDEHALRFLTAMHKQGLTAPKDFRIVGYNNTDASHYSDPPLSTVAQNFEYIGLGLLESAIALSQGKVSQVAETPVLRFIVRETCGGKDHLNPELIENLRKRNLQLILEHGEAGGVQNDESETYDLPAEAGVR